MEPNRRDQDHPEIEPEIRPTLGVIEGGGETTPDRANLKSAEAAQNLGDQERKFGVIQGGGESTPDRANLKAAEEESNWDNNTTPGGGSKKKQPFLAKVKNFAKKKGAIIAISGILGIGGGSIALLPALLPQLPRVDSESLYDNVSRTNIAHNKMSLRNMIGNREACKGNPGGIRCKLASVNDKTLDRYDKQGFKIETEKVGDRHLITAATFPDGTRVTNGADFVAHMDASVSARSKVFGVFDPGNASFVGRKFTEFLKRFNIGKDKIVLSDKDKKAVAQSFNDKIQAPDDEKAAADEKSKGAKATIEDFKTKAGTKITNFLGVGCGVYNFARVGVGAVKAENMARYIALIYFFIKLGDQIRAGDADSATVSAAMGLLTKYSTSGPNAGKTALDSPGFKAMAYGDRTNLDSSMQKILLGGNPALIEIDSALVAIKSAIGAKGVHAGCKIANDRVLGGALSTAVCAASGAASGTVVPIVGNVVGGVAGILTCTAIDIALATAGGFAISKIIDLIMPSIVKYLADVNINYDMPAVDLGNAMTIGAGLLFGIVGLNHGGKLATKDEALHFKQVTYNDENQYEEVARYNARDTPFDINNQYSFMGTLVNKLGLESYSGNSALSALSMVGSIFGNATTSFLPPAFAADQASPLKEGTLGTCLDPELKAKNLGCDAVGGTQVVQSEEEMNADTDTVVKYMIANNYIDENGTVNNDKDYAKYAKYCTGAGQEIPGTSTLAVEDDDYLWPDKKCQEQNEMMSNFRTYTARVALEDDRDTYYDKPDNSTAPTTEAPGGVTPGGSIDGDDYKSECSKYAFCTGQCVDFVLFRLVKHGVLPGKQHMGNGKDVAANLGKQLGVAVNSTPAVHSVMSTSHTSHPDLGHTAIVSQVNADGSIVVEEYNFTNPLHYDTRTISAQQIKDDGMVFAHVEASYK